MLGPMILGALLLGPLCAAAPVAQQPQSQQPEAPLPNPLQAKIHEKLSTPKQWAEDIPTELANEGLGPPVVAAAEPEVEPTEIVVEKMNWDSTATDRFKDFLAVLKKKQRGNRQQEQMVPEQMLRGGDPNRDPRYAGSMSAGAPLSSDRSSVNWGLKKRSVIPKKFKKGAKEEEVQEEKLPEVVEEIPEEVVEEVELTNEDFDEMFRFYGEKYDSRGFEGLQGHLDGMMGRGKEDWRQKAWKPESELAPGTQFRRRDLGSATTSPRYSPTPENFVSESDQKPAISINPEVFNRIAADYQFDKNPTTINNEDSFFSRNSASQSSGHEFGQTSTDRSSGRGKQSASTKLNKRSFGSHLYPRSLYKHDASYVSQEV